MVTRKVTTIINPGFHVTSNSEKPGSLTAANKAVATVTEIVSLMAKIMAMKTDIGIVQFLRQWKCAIPAGNMLANITLSLFTSEILAKINPNIRITRKKHKKYVKKHAISGML